MQVFFAIVGLLSVFLLEITYLVPCAFVLSLVLVIFSAVAGFESFDLADERVNV